jgi:tripartite-type tricarboxylate transporter receptor subunit TctC
MNASALRTALSLLVLAAAATPELAPGQAYPSRPVRMIVGFQAGTGVDFAARAIGEKLAESLGQPFVVDNRPGAGANIAAEAVARAAPDGYTLLVANNSLAINPTIYPKLAYDSVRDFAPISLAGTSPMLLAANPSVPAGSVKELIEFARSKPGTLNLASAGTGSPSHLAGALFTHMAGIRLVHVPYKGAPAAFNDLIAGQVSLYFSGLPPAIPMVKAGRARAVAVTTTYRSAALPDVPTLAESGLPGYDVPLWYGVLAPAGTPPGVIATLNAQIVRALRLPDVASRFAAQGVEPATSTPGEFASQIQTEIGRWTEVVRTANIKVE